MFGRATGKGFDFTFPDPDPSAPMGATIHVNMNVDFEDFNAEVLTEDEKMQFW